MRHLTARALAALLIVAAAVLGGASAKCGALLKGINFNGYASPTPRARARTVPLPACAAQALTPPCTSGCGRRALLSANCGKLDGVANPGGTAALPRFTLRERLDVAHLDTLTRARSGYATVACRHPRAQRAPRFAGPMTVRPLAEPPCPGW